LTRSRMCGASPDGSYRGRGSHLRMHTAHFRHLLSSHNFVTVLTGDTFGSVLTPRGRLGASAEVTGLPARRPALALPVVRCAHASPRSGAPATQDVKAMKM